jgi:hypothetical protein
MQYLYIAGGIVMAGLAITAFIFFKLYTAELQTTAALRQSNTQLTKTIEDKANAQKQRNTIERKNSTLDYPALVDKLR